MDTLELIVKIIVGLVEAVVQIAAASTLASLAAVAVEFVTAPLLGSDD